MSYCFCDACTYNKIDTYNSLLIVKSPYPEKDNVSCINIGLCLLCPWRTLESTFMLTYGIITCPIPCLVCNMVTEHQRDNIGVNNCHPDFAWIPSPVHFDYSIRGVSTTRGIDIGLNYGNNRPQGPGGSFHIQSYITGGRIFRAGIEKILSSTCDCVCCPVNLYYWCCNICK